MNNYTFFDNMVADLRSFIEKGKVVRVRKGGIGEANYVLEVEERSNVALAGVASGSLDEPFVEIDRLRGLFGQWAGTELATRITCVPTGTMERITGFHDWEYMRINGSRTFPAHDFAGMVDWMAKHSPADLLALRRIDPEGLENLLEESK